MPAFDAVASALGYAFQFRYALEQALLAMGDGLDWVIGVETADDVEIATPDDGRLVQLKHHVKPGNLTDGSTDLWKSLRIWAEGVLNGDLDPTRSHLFLVTTSSVPAGSIAALLTDDDAVRDEQTASTRLTAIANAAGNDALDKAYASWLQLDSARQMALLQSLEVMGDAGDIDAVLERMTRHLALAVRRDNIPAFTEVLEGWWFQRCVRALTGKSERYISGTEFDARYTELREQFLPGNLPLMPGVFDLPADPEEFAERIFVRQLKISEVSATRISHAVRDYMRAFAQRSFWLRTQVLMPIDLAEYERRLMEEWEYVFDRLVEDLPAEAAEEQKIGIARQVYAWVEEASAPPIRDLFSEKFVTRGSMQILADDLRTGWHPDFLVRLMAILEPVGKDA